MTKEELASLLNGRQYGSEISKDEAKQAKENGLVIVYGYSDDNLEFEGAISDEVGAFDGREVLIYQHPKTKVWDLLTEDDEEKAEEWGVETRLIKAIWCPENLDCSWLIESEIPNAEFDILEDDELFCRGIVFSIIGL